MCKKKKALSNQNGYKCLKRKIAVGLSSSGASKIRQSKRQVSKDTFHKWQWTYTRGSISLWLWPQWWLCAEIDDQGKSLVSTLWCVVGSTRLEYAGPKTSSGHGSIVQATIKQATSLTTPAVSHTKRPWCTFVLSYVKLHCGLTKFRLLSKLFSSLKQRNDRTPYTPRPCIIPMRMLGSSLPSNVHSVARAEQSWQSM